MNKAIIITGTPGTGKTTISKMLSTHGYEVHEVGKIVKEKHLYTLYDDEMECYVVDDNLLTPVLVELIENNSSPVPIILDGHVMIIPSEYIYHCIVLRCSIKTLRIRLEEREYKPSKIEENVEAEIMEVILTEMLKSYGEENVSVVNTDETEENSCNDVLNIIKGRKERKEEDSTC